MYLDAIAGKLRGSQIDSHLHNTPLLSFMGGNLKRYLIRPQVKYIFPHNIESTTRCSIFLEISQHCNNHGEAQLIRKY